MRLIAYAILTELCDLQIQRKVNQAPPPSSSAEKRVEWSRKAHPVNISSKRMIMMSISKGEEYICLENVVSPSACLEAMMNGSKVPSSRAISLGPDQVSTMLDHYTDLRNLRLKMCVGDMMDFSVHLGNNIMLTSSKEMALVHIRRYWKPKVGDEILPTKIGITLREEELANLLAVFPLYARCLNYDKQPYLKLVERCNELLEYSSKVPTIMHDDDHMTHMAPKIRVDAPALHTPRMSQYTSTRSAGARGARGKENEKEKREEEEEEEEEEGMDEEDEDDAMSDISDNTLLLADSQAMPSPKVSDDEMDAQPLPSPGEEETPSSRQPPAPGRDQKTTTSSGTNTVVGGLPPVSTFLTPTDNVPTPDKGTFCMPPARPGKRKFSKVNEMATSTPQQGQKKTKLRRALFPKKTVPTHQRK